MQNNIYKKQLKNERLGLKFKWCKTACTLGFAFTKL